MIKTVRQFISGFCLCLVVFFLVFGTFNLKLKALTIKQNDQLVERIAKDFSKKFCNGVGFGLSEESAMNFAMKENIAIFKKKNGIKDVDSLAITEKVSVEVIDNCGYPLKLKKETWELALENG